MIEITTRNSQVCNNYMAHSCWRTCKKLLDLASHTTSWSLAEEIGKVTGFPKSYTFYGISKGEHSTHFFKSYPCLVWGYSNTNQSWHKHVTIPCQKLFHMKQTCCGRSVFLRSPFTYQYDLVHNPKQMRPHQQPQGKDFSGQMTIPKNLWSSTRWFLVSRQNVAMPGRNNDKQMTVIYFHQISTADHFLPKLVWYT